VTENFAGLAQDEVVDICRDLIRIDTTNPGDHSGPGERRAAEYVAGLLSEVGLQPTVLESHSKRTSLVARVEGSDPSRPALLIHGHLDVVPANASDWALDPFGGEIADGCVWGRGAVDMKDMDAMVLAAVRQRRREGRRPARDIVLAALSSAQVDFKGEYFQVRDFPMVLQCLQKPRPPLWYGLGNPDSAVWAAQVSANVISLRAPAATKVALDRYPGPITGTDWVLVCRRGRGRCRV